MFHPSKRAVNWPRLIQKTISLGYYIVLTTLPILIFCLLGQYITMCYQKVLQVMQRNTNNNQDCVFMVNVRLIENLDRVCRLLLEKFGVVLLIIYISTIANLIISSYFIVLSIIQLNPFPIAWNVLQLLDFLIKLFAICWTVDSFRNSVGLSIFSNTKLIINCVTF